LNLPYDYPRPVIQSFEGANLTFEVGEEIKRNINQLTKETNTTLYMNLLAVFNILLMKYTGQEDISYRFADSRETACDLENIAGMFVNTMAMRNKPAGDKTFKEFFVQGKGKHIKAYENQDYQF